MNYLGNCLKHARSISSTKTKNFQHYKFFSSFHFTLSRFRTKQVFFIQLQGFLKILKIQEFIYPYVQHGHVCKNLRNPAVAFKVITIWSLRGYSQTTLTKRSRLVLEMSTVSRFSLIPVKEFLHKCQQEVGRWSLMGKILSNQFVNAPLHD